ncbi:MAG TPA: hypothetical protein VFY84_01930 [Jiangellales bacterium]|nr:hypothetical protein [Jiangellales bacterium]
MKRHRPARRQLILAAVGAALAVLLSSATVASPAQAAGSGPTPGAARSVERFRFHFGDRFGPIRLARHWSATGCYEQFVCLSDGRRSGQAEWGVFPLEPVPAGSRAARQDLRNRVQDFLDDLARDRAVGCPGYRFHAERVVPATVIGLHGVRVSFSLTTASGRTAERTVAFWARQPTGMFVLTAEALDPGSCLEPLGDQFTVAGLRRAEPALRQLALWGGPPPDDQL